MAHDSRAGRTRDRILDAALKLFNEQGVEKTSTNRIATELSMSSGNLYYHFKSKQQIVESLVLRVEMQLETVAANAPAVEAIDDFWLSLHLVFEAVHQYRFVFRDVEHVIHESQSAAIRVRRITSRMFESAGDMCGALVAADVIRASAEEVAVLALHVVFAATCWINFTRLLPVERHDESAGRAAYHVLTLFTPYLADNFQPYMRYLRSKYLA